MLRILFLSIFTLFPVTAMAEETQLPPWATTFWNGWEQLAELSGAEAEAIATDPERLAEHFGTGVEGLTNFGTRVANGDIETRNPFTAIGGYAEASAQCIATKVWLDEHQANVQALWGFLQAHAAERENIDAIAGLIVAFASSPRIVTSEQLPDFFNPAQLGDYLSSNALPTCGLPKSTSLIQSLQTPEAAAVIPQAQGEIIVALMAQALQGNDEAIRLLGWLATLNLTP